MDCADLDKTNAYIQRSRGSPLEIYLTAHYHHDALLLTLPLIGRLKALTLSRSRHVLRLTKHFRSHAPLLEKLDIQAQGASVIPLESAIFGGNLSSLRELRLYAILTDLPWKNLTNLTASEFCQVPGDEISVTLLLDFFEHAPLLRKIELVDSLPDFSNAPPKRAVSLPRLRFLRIDAQQPHSVLLNHLHIPIRASVTLDFELDDDSAPLPHHFPTSLDNLNNIPHITSISLAFNSGMDMRLNGPSGGLHVFGAWANGGSTPLTLDSQILRCLNKFPISTAEMLVITVYDGSADPKPEGSGAYQALLPMNNLRTLILNYCIDPSFVFVLNPNRNTSNTVVCPNLEELILRARDLEGEPCIDELLEMVKERASRGAKLSTLVIICRRERIPPERVYRLRKYVEHVEHRLGDESPEWDAVPGEVN